MAKMIDDIREKLLDHVLSLEEIDSVLEENKYLPIETDEDDIDTLKYSNNKSQIWIKYMSDDGEYLVSEITMKTKKRGKTEVDPFYREEDIKNMIDYFRNNHYHQEFLITMFGFLLARRIGDILSLKWSDFYYENGRRKEVLNTLIEQKTDKTIDISVSNVTWKYIDEYCSMENINPLEHLNEDIFPRESKTYAKNKEEYDKEVKKQAASYRHQFKKAADYLGIENVSTHSLRKSFGYIAHEINKYDPDCLGILQTVYGHTDTETTKRYIGVMREKARKCFNSVAQRIEDIDNGVKSAIDNAPVIAMKTNDLRDILLEAIKSGRETNAEIDADTLKDLLSKVESIRVS